MAEADVTKILARNEALKTAKMPILAVYQRIAEYVMNRQSNFTVDGAFGIFLDDVVFDQTAPRANQIMGSSMRGALWPNSADTFEVVPASSVLEQDSTAKIKEFFIWATQQVQNVFDDPKAGFNNAHEEYWMDQGPFGTSGMWALENDDNSRPIMFSSIDVKRSCIAEGSDGTVDTVYTEKMYTVRQLVQEYKLENCSKLVQEKFFKKQLDEKIKVLHAVEPRSDGVMGSLAAADMPVASIHMEAESKTILKNGGFTEFPGAVTRFWKVPGEDYGRSVAMWVMADILEINAMREAVIIATEKLLDPPLAVNDESILGNGTIDTSPGAINVRRESSRMQTKGLPAVEPIYTIGEINATYKRLEYLEQIILKAFFNDTLMDLNNDQRMTLGEANIRDRRQMQMLGSIFSRQMSEFYLPLIERVFRVLYTRGLLGVVENSVQYFQQKAAGITPKVIPMAVYRAGAEGRDMFKIVFRSPAARVMQIDRLDGIQSTIGFATTTATAAGKPELLDVINFDEALREFAELKGALSRITRAEDDVTRIRKNRDAQNQKIAAVQDQQVQAETAKTQAQAAHFAVKSGIKIA